MTVSGRMALDANILIRAVLGRRVNALFSAYRPYVEFFAPAECFDDARRYVPSVVGTRFPGKTAQALETLDILEDDGVVEKIDRSRYAMFEREARRRIEARDPDDWPLVALALTLDCPIWTEDNDFFGTGIPVWNTANVEIYLRERADKSSAHPSLTR